MRETERLFLYALPTSTSSYSLLQRIADGGKPGHAGDGRQSSGSGNEITLQADAERGSSSWKRGKSQLAIKIDFLVPASCQSPGQPASQWHESRFCQSEIEER